jgi:hypothetical protein
VPRVARERRRGLLPPARLKPSEFQPAWQMVRDAVAPLRASCAGVNAPAVAPQFSSYWHGISSPCIACLCACSSASDLSRCCSTDHVKSTGRSRYTRRCWLGVVMGRGVPRLDRGTS